MGALLDQELRKPPEQQDEERLHTLRVKYRKMQLINVQVCGWGGGRSCAVPVAGGASCRCQGGLATRSSRTCAPAGLHGPALFNPTPEPLHIRVLQVRAETFVFKANCLEEPGAHECCAAAGWVRRRRAASYRALNDYYCQDIQQVGHGRW